MTCIIGLKHRGHVYMACDSRIENGWSYRTLPDDARKLFRVGDVLIGGAGDWRMCLAVRFGLTLEPQTQKQTDFEYIAQALAGGIRAVLKEYGYAKVENSREDAEGKFLAAYRGQLYSVDRLFAARPVLGDFEAIGTGDETAMGAMAVLIDSGLPPKKLLRRALKITARYAIGVSGPYHVERH